MKTKLYIMQAGDFIKIGVTSNSVSSRASQIQTGCPLPIEEIEYLEFDSSAEAYEMEKIVHKEFSFYNSHGEWFAKFKRYTTKICKTIDKQTSDIKRVTFNAKINFHVDQIIKKREKARELKTNALNSIVSNPSESCEIRAFQKLSDKDRQKRLEKVIKNNPHVFKKEI